MRHVQSGKCDLPVTSTFPFAFHTSFLLQVVIVDLYVRSQIQMFTRSDSVVVWFYPPSPGRWGKGLDKATITSFHLLCNSAFILPFCII